MDDDAARRDQAEQAKRRDELRAEPPGASGVSERGRIVRIDAVQGRPGKKPEPPEKEHR
jgi:hypothetical protein